MLLLFIAFGVIAIIFKKSNKARKESTLPSAADTDTKMSQNPTYNISRSAANNGNDERMYPAINTAEGIEKNPSSFYNSMNVIHCLQLLLQVMHNCMKKLMSHQLCLKVMILTMKTKSGSSLRRGTLLLQ